MLPKARPPIRLASGQKTAKPVVRPRPLHLGPKATALFGHPDALAGPHAQMNAHALGRGARKACRINALGQALPLGLAAVVQPSLRTTFARIDALVGRAPCPPKSVPATSAPRVPGWRYADYGASQAASLLGLNLKLSLLMGACVYHVVASVVVGLCFGLEAGRARLGAQAIGRAIQWQHLRAPQSFGAQLGRSLVDACLGLSKPQRTSVPKTSGSALTAHLIDVAYALDPARVSDAAAFLRHGESFEPMCASWRKLAQDASFSMGTLLDALRYNDAHLHRRRSLETALQQTLAHVMHCCAVQPGPTWLPRALKDAVASLDCVAIDEALSSGDMAAAHAQLARIDLQPVIAALTDAEVSDSLATWIEQLDLTALRLALRADAHDFVAPCVTQANQKALGRAIRGIDWREVSGFIASLHASDVARDLASRVPRSLLCRRLQDFARCRDRHLGRVVI